MNCFNREATIGCLRQGISASNDHGFPGKSIRDPVTGSKIGFVCCVVKNLLSYVCLRDLLTPGNAKLEERSSHTDRHPTEDLYSVPNYASGQNGKKSFLADIP